MVDWQSIDSSPSFSQASGVFLGTAATFSGSSEILPHGNSTSDFNSILDGSATDFGNGSVFTPSIATTDALNFNGNVIWTIDFGQTVANPIIHITNLARDLKDFSAFPTVVSQNGF
ncbi:MAG: hypothetical protein R3C03_11495 [Pirellulaceae bacterium]